MTQEAEAAEAPQEATAPDAPASEEEDKPAEAPKETEVGDPSPGGEEVDKASNGLDAEVTASEQPDEGAGKVVDEEPPVHPAPGTVELPADAAQAPSSDAADVDASSTVDAGAAAGTPPSVPAAAVAGTDADATATPCNDDTVASSGHTDATRVSSVDAAAPSSAGVAEGAADTARGGSGDEEGDAARKASPAQSPADAADETPVPVAGAAAEADDAEPTPGVATTAQDDAAVASNDATSAPALTEDTPSQACLETPAVKDATVADDDKGGDTGVVGSNVEASADGSGSRPIDGTGIAEEPLQDALGPRQEVSVTVTRSDEVDASLTYILGPNSGPIRIGRSPANHIKVDLRGISAYHLELRAGRRRPGDTEGSLVNACDLSMNGTQLECARGELLPLQKNFERPIPDGARLVMPAKVKREEEKSNPNSKCWLTVRWRRPSDAKVDESVGGNSSDTHSPSQAASEPEVPQLPRNLLERHRQAPAAATLPPAAPAVARSKSRSSSPPSAASAPGVEKPAAKSSLPSGSQLRPKALPKKQDAVASRADPEAAATPPVAAEAAAEMSQKASKKANAQKSRSRDRGSSGSRARSRSRSRSRSRGRGRGRGRKRSRSSSDSRSRSRSPSRKRKRKRKKSKSRGRRKRKKSKSRSSSRSRSRREDEPAPAAEAAGSTPMAAVSGNMGGMQPSNMAGMQPSWGMAWNPQAYWGHYMQQGAQVGAQPQMNVDMVKQQIYFMYQRFKPEKLPEFETILKKYKGSEYELLQAMCTKYLSGGAAAGGAMASGAR